MVSEHSDDENTSTEAKDTNTANRKAGQNRRCRACRERIREDRENR